MENGPAGSGDCVKDNDVTRAQPDCNDILAVCEGFWGMVEGNFARTRSPFVWAPLHHLNRLKGLRSVPLAEPRRGWGKWKGIVVNVRGGITDCVEVQQDETLALVCPPAGDPCLYAHQHVSRQIPITTHRQIPLIYVIEGINADAEVSREAEDLDPKQ